MRTELSLVPGSSCTMLARAGDAARWQADLVRELRWEQRHIVFVRQARAAAAPDRWAGELPYRYFGQR